MLHVQRYVEAHLQRLFSTFANGWPGIGLLLLRLATAATPLYAAIAQFRSTPQLASIIPQLIGAGAGKMLLVGFWTPVAGTVIVVAELWIVIAGGDPRLSLLLAMLGAGLAMIGPGAWSVDARLFGRKHLGISSR